MRLDKLLSLGKNHPKARKTRCRCCPGKYACSQGEWTQHPGRSQVSCQSSSDNCHPGDEEAHFPESNGPSRMPAHFFLRAHGCSPGVMENRQEAPNLDSRQRDVIKGSGRKKPEPGIYRRSIRVSKEEVKEYYGLTTDEVLQWNAVEEQDACE